MADVIVKKSNIHGKGAFAARDFKKGEIVLRWDRSHMLTKKEAENFPKNLKKYVNYHKGAYLVMQSPERFVNHSCNPNTKVKDFGDIAIRDIKKGEQITSDYAVDASLDFEMKCNCGSKDCRRTITK